METKCHGDGVFFFRQGCLKLRQTPRQYDILATTYSFSGFLSAACLSGQRRSRKKGKFKCGNDFLCSRGCELERHWLVLISSWLENNPHFLSPFPNCGVVCRRIVSTQTLSSDCCLATYHCKLLISTANLLFCK